LRLAQGLLRAHRMRDAIHELEEGIDVVTGGNGPDRGRRDASARYIAAQTG